MTAASRLHLLRPFTEWRTGGSVSAAEQWIASLPDDATFATWTARCPARLPELAGGSVYFVRARHAVFRMPFLRVAPSSRKFAIVMTPRLIRVERRRVGFVRGWRYLNDADAPADLAPREDIGAGDMPPGMFSELREAGLV